MKKKIIMGKNEISLVCKRLAKEIDLFLKNEEKIPVVVGVLKGSINFMMDLIKYIKADIFTDYIHIRSYSGTKSTGKVELLKDLSFDCQNRTVIIIEDVIDTGVSMSYLIEHINTHHPKRILVCSMFDKKAERKTNVRVDFVGKELKGNDFLIGYGLDYCELGRDIPYVYAATKRDIDRFNKILKEDQKEL